MTGTDRTAAKDQKILDGFVDVYCRQHHGQEDDRLCDECADLLAYATKRRENCPHDPKPKCKDCSTHCYKPEYRDRIKAVMRFSGMYFVKRGRLDWLARYFFEGER